MHDRARRFTMGAPRALRRLATSAAVMVNVALASPALAADHPHDPPHGAAPSAHPPAGHAPAHPSGPAHRPGPTRRGPGLFLGAPAVVLPPPVYYAPTYPTPYGAYPYAPEPVTGVYATPQGYCQDYRTAAGIETACQGPDGVWRFIN